MIQRNGWVRVVLEPHHDTPALFKVELPAPGKTLINAGCDEIVGENSKVNSARE